jgi:hypothetical protein
VPYEGLSQAQSFSLLSEMQSAKNLMRDGRAAIRQLQFTTTGSDAVFTLTSIGVEKMMKVVLGLISLRDQGRWLSDKEMRSFGHGVAAMNVHVLGQLRANITNATHRGHAEDALTGLETNTLWPKLVDVLDAYGRSGRFYYLDHLASGQMLTKDSPLALWHELENDVTREDPNMLSAIASLDQHEHDAGIEALNTAIAGSLTAWWECVYRFLIQGAFGPIGRQISSELAPE